MRKYVKGPFFKGILWVILIAMVGFWGSASWLRKSRGYKAGQTIATVNDIEITSAEYNRATANVQEFIRTIRSQYKQYADMFMQMMGLNADPKVMALETLIRNALINDAASRLHIYLTNDYAISQLNGQGAVQRQLAEILPNYVFDPETGGINSAALHQYLAREQISAEDYIEMVKGALERSITMEWASLAAYVPQFAIQQRFVKDQVKKQYSVLTLPFDIVLKKEQATQPNEQELKNFFDEQNSLVKRYFTPEQRTGISWTFDAKDYGITVNDQEIENYYQDYKGQKFVASPMQMQARTIVFKDTGNESMEKATKLRAQLIENPELFAQKAKELSEDKESAPKGGIIPYFAKGTHDKAFERAVFLLKNDNDIAEPVITKNGIEIVQRVAKKPAEYKPLEAVKNDIKEQLLVLKFKEQFAEDSHQYIFDDVPTGMPFDEFIKKHNAQKETVTASALDKSKSFKALFAIHHPGSRHSYFDGSKAIIVELETIVPRKASPLDTVKETVIKDFHNERAHKEFARIIKETAAQAVTEPLASLAAKIGATVEKVDFIAQENTEAVQELNKKNIPTNIFWGLEKVGSVATDVQDQKAFIVRVDALEKVDATAFDQAQKTLVQKLNREYSTYFIESFVASLYRNGKINTSESMENSNNDRGDIGTEDYL